MKKAGIAGILYFLFLFLLFLPVIVSPCSSLLFGDDIHEVHYFSQEFIQNQLQHHEMPFWNPYQFGGTPILGNPQAVPLYPFNIVFTLIPLRISFPLFFIIHLTLAGIGMYVLLKHYTDDISAWGSGMVFLLSGFFMARIYAGHVGIIAAGSWAPWIIASYIRLQTKKEAFRYLFLGSVFTGLQLIAGYQSMAVFTYEALFMLGLYYCYTKKSLKPMASILFIGFLGIGISAYQFFPILEFLNHSIRTFPFSFGWAVRGASTIESLQMIIQPFVYGTPGNYHGPVVNFSEHAAYIGISSLGIILVGFCVFFIRKIFHVPWIDRWVKFPHRFSEFVLLWLVMAGVGIVLALADNFPLPIYRMLWQYVPLFQSLRIPSRQLFLFTISGSVLLGLTLSILKEKSFRLIVVGVIALDLIVFSRQCIQVRPNPLESEDKKLTSLFRTEEVSRVVPNYGCWIEPKSVYRFNAPQVHGVFSATGYDPMILRNYYDFIDAANGNSGSSILEQDVQAPYLSLGSRAFDFLNIRYLMTPTYVADPLGGKNTNQFTLIMENKPRQYRVYENKSVLPRFFFARNILQFHDLKKVREAIRTGSVDIRQDAALVGAAPFAASQCTHTYGQTIRIESYATNSIRLQVSTDCEALLMSSEVMYPGWEARIDGKKAEILTANMAFRAVIVPKGEHGIEFMYMPYTLFIGIGITLLTFSGFLVYAAVLRVKKFQKH